MLADVAVTGTPTPVEELQLGLFVSLGVTEVGGAVVTEGDGGFADAKGEEALGEGFVSVDGLLDADL